MREKEVIKKLFLDIDNLILYCTSNRPVLMCDSKFLKGYDKLKSKYLR